MTDIKQYLVGGAVRDNLLGLPCDDFDYLLVGLGIEDLEKWLESNSYKPLNSGTYLINLDLKTAKAINNLGQVVDFKVASSLEEDLLSRDFTMNSMAMDLDTYEIIDLPAINGRQALEDGLLFFNGSPRDVLRKHPERLIRAARFSQKLNLMYDSDICSAFSHPEYLGWLKEVNVSILNVQMGKWLKSVGPLKVINFLGVNRAFATALFDTELKLKITT
jgi:tRNA nucleotidyltransferase/poly(A) polymerase